MKVNSQTDCCAGAPNPRRAALALGGAAGVFALLSILPPEGAFRTTSGSVVEGWFFGWVRMAWPLAACALAALSAFAWRRSGAALRGVAPGWRSRASLLQALRPLSWLPLCSALRHVSAFVGPAATALVLPLGSAALLAWSLERATRDDFRLPAEAPPRRRGAKEAAMAFLLAFAALGSVYLWQGRDRFVGGGDVVHYMMQLDNLLQKGNLDVTETMERLMESRHVPRGGAEEREFILRSHARRNARGRIYSVHAFGYPLLAYPFARAFGRDAGTALLGILLGALGICAVWSSARLCGAGATASALTSSLLAMSWFWAFTSASRLPEMLGCALVAWGFWAALAAIGSGAEGLSGGSFARLAVSGLVSAACCIWLPVSHLRFFPVAAVLAAAWIASAVASGAGGARRRAFAATAFAAAVGASWWVLWHSHGKMFEGVSSFTLQAIFFSRPIAMLGMFADRLGAAALFPLLWLLCLAPLPLALSRRASAELRAGAALALALEATTLVACCAQPGAIGGACVSGRYFLQAIAPLVAIGAVWLSRTGPAGRVWYFLLGLLPVLYLLVVSPVCSGGGLVYSPLGVYDLDCLRQLPMPLPKILETVPGGGFARALAGLAVPLAAFVVSALLARPRPTRARLAVVAAALALGTAGGLWADTFLPRVQANPAWAFSHRNHWHDFRLISGSAAPDFFAAFRTEGEEPNAPSLLIFGGEAPEPQPETRRPVDVRRVRPNDWFGRDLRWIEMRPFPLRDATAGALAVRVKGRVLRGKARLAVSIGPQAFPGEGLSVGEGPFDAVLLVPRRRGAGSATTFAALDGADGALEIDFVEVAPYARGLEGAVGPFPPGAVISDSLRR